VGHFEGAKGAKNLQRPPFLFTHHKAGWHFCQHAKFKVKNATGFREIGGQRKFVLGANPETGNGNRTISMGICRPLRSLQNITQTPAKWLNTRRY